MKDMLKRLLCVMLALVMVMALCACGQSEDGGKKGKEKEEEETTEEKPEQVLVGEWEAYLDLTDYFNDMMAEELDMDDLVEEFSMRIVMEFTEDGEVTLTIDQDHMEDMVNDFADSFWDAMMDMYAEEYDMSRSEVEQAMAESGVTKEALVEEMDIESLFEDLEDMEGYWVLEDDELFISEDEDDLEDADPIEIEFDGDDNFSMVGGDGLTDGLDEDMADLFLPLEFERI